MKDKKVIWSSHQGFMKGKSCLTKFIDFYNEVTVMVDVVHLIFSKAFNAISHNILTDKLMKCGLDIWTVRWIENWLNDQA